MMLVVSSPMSGFSSGVFGNRPEERKRLVKKMFEENQFEMLDVEEEHPDLNYALVCHSADLLDFYMTAWTRWRGVCSVYLFISHFLFICYLQNCWERAKFRHI
jgi:hypothetical protein